MPQRKTTALAPVTVDQELSVTAHAAIPQDAVLSDTLRARRRIVQMTKSLHAMSQRAWASGNRHRAAQLLKIRWALHRRLKLVESRIRAICYSSLLRVRGAGTKRFERSAPQSAG